MLRAIGGALDTGMVAHGEIFAPTLCAMHRHLHNNCTTADLRSRRGHDLSPITTAWGDMEDDRHKMRLDVRQRGLVLHPKRWNHVDREIYCSAYNLIDRKLGRNASADVRAACQDESARPTDGRKRRAAGADESFATESASGDMAGRSALLASHFNRTLGKQGECNAHCCVKKNSWCCTDDAAWRRTRP